jgi:hypothetical protein
VHLVAFGLMGGGAQAPWVDDWSGVRPFPANSYRFLPNRPHLIEQEAIALLSRGLIAICEEQTGKHFE